MILTEDAAADAPFVGPADGVAAAIEQISASLDGNPVAGTSLALHRCSKPQLLRHAVRSEVLLCCLGNKTTLRVPKTPSVQVRAMTPGAFGRRASSP